MSNHENAASTHSSTPVSPFFFSLDGWKQREESLRKFISDYLVVGEDVGTMPGTNNGKFVLFKPGAEKLCLFMGLGSAVAGVVRTEDWDKGFVAYEVTVQLVDKAGIVAAEAVGNCNSRERKYKTQDAANIANTVLKMAHKRALIAATLLASGAGGMLEGEGEPTEDGETREHTRPSTQRPVQTSGRFPGRPPAGGDVNDVATLTEPQRAAILSLANKLWGGDAPKFLKQYGDIENLSRRDASKTIDELRAKIDDGRS